MASDAKPAGTILTETHAARGISSAEFLLRHLPQDAHLLDVGSGPGSITVEIASFLHQGAVIGVDLDPERVASAEELARRNGIRNVRFEASDAYSLPFNDDTFDAVFCHTVLLHLANPLRAITEMVRVAKPGALVGVSDTDHDGWLFSPAVPNDMAEGQQFIYDWKASRGGNYFIGKHLKGLLRKAGLRDLVVTASSNANATPEGLAGHASNNARFYADPDARAYAQERGIEDFDSRASRWEKSMREWAKDPDALIIRLKCEVVGRKP